MRTAKGGYAARLAARAGGAAGPVTGRAASVVPPRFSARVVPAGAGAGPLASPRYLARLRFAPPCLPIVIIFFQTFGRSWLVFGCIATDGGRNVSKHRHITYKNY